MERKAEDYEKGLVSVITPVYNAEKAIEKTLESVFAQTYKSIEIVLVDDCSKDNSASIIKKLQKTHSEIVYLQPKNMGLDMQETKLWNLHEVSMLHFWMLMTFGSRARLRNRSTI